MMATENKNADQFEPQKIPEGCVDFAKAVALAANEHGVDKCTVDFSPKFKEFPDTNRRYFGLLRIKYSAVDGRGRPCLNLQIEFDSKVTIPITTTPPSSG